MPIIWMKIPTGSTPEVHERRGDPDALREYVATVVDRAGARLEDLYFEVGAARACALIDGLDDYVRLKAVSHILGAESVTKLVRAKQAAEALSLANEWRRPTESA